MRTPPSPDALDWTFQQLSASQKQTTKLVWKTRNWVYFRTITRNLQRFRRNPLPLNTPLRYAISYDGAIWWSFALFCLQKFEKSAFQFNSSTSGEGGRWELFISTWLNLHVEASGPFPGWTKPCAWLWKTRMNFWRPGHRTAASFRRCPRLHMDTRRRRNKLRNAFKIIN